MTPYWHIHHQTLLEFATEPIENRIAYIKSYKPAHERETRLRLLKQVQGTLPAALTKAWTKYNKAWAAYNKASAAVTKASAAYTKARAAWDEAWAAYADNLPAIEALHTLECPGCPWNGRTIFP